MKRTGMTHPRVINLDSDLMRLGRGNLHVFDRKVFASFPSYCSL